MARVKPCAEKWVINRDELGTFPAPREPQTVVDTDQWSIWSGVCACSEEVEGCRDGRRDRGEVGIGEGFLEE